VYASRVDQLPAVQRLPAPAVSAIHDSVAGAVDVASRLQGTVGARVGAQIASDAKDAFMVGLHRGVLVAALAALIGSVVAWVWLPARGTEPQEIAATPDEVAEVQEAEAGGALPQPAYAAETT
jgi:hypothetical protein